MKARTLVLLAVLACPSLGQAGIVVDLAATAADWTVWGAQNGSTGRSAQIGDVNGDGQADLVFSEYGWNGSTRLGEGRVCIVFGPLALPGVVDLLTFIPATCIEGDAQGRSLGTDLALGDLDGDGVPDLLIGTASAGPDGKRINAGAVAIFRGRAIWPAVLHFSDADWIFYGIDPGDGLSIAAAGDLNGDGAPDLSLYAPSAFGPSDSRAFAGEGYVKFGPASGWPKRVFDLAVDAPDVTIYGANGAGDNPSVPDHFGSEVTIADVLGDGIPDLIVGAPDGAGPTNVLFSAGEVYVFRGRPSWPAVIDTRTPGSADLLVYGPADTVFLGPSAVADWDGDGQPDLILGGGVYTPPATTRTRAGGIFILRGRSGLSGIWDLAQKPADETIIGAFPFQGIGFQLQTGDVNGDGYVDIVTQGDDPAKMSAGGLVVIPGCGGFERFRDLAVEPGAMSIYGRTAGDDLAVWAPAGIGDIDGDGRADMFVGASDSKSLGNSRAPYTGEAHLVLGRPFDAACTLVADAGPGATTCGPQAVVLDGSSSVVMGCPSAAQYRWMLGTTVVQDWTATPTVSVTPAATTTYRLDVRCGDCVSGICTGSAKVKVTVDPDLRPGDLGNWLFAHRSNQDVVLVWAPDSLARTYSLYRGTQKGLWPTPAQFLGLALPAETLTDVPSPPDLYFYRTAGASCSGREGP